jgi:hypothetical protein
LYSIAWLYQICTQIVGQCQRWIHLALQLATEKNTTVGSTECVNASLDFGSEMTHETLNWPCSRVAKSTDRAPFHLFAVNEIT